MKIVTLFAPGSYGTFISWCVYSFSNLNQIDTIIPTSNRFGSAHKFREADGFNVMPASNYPLDKSYTNYILVECNKEKIINYIDNQCQKQFLNNPEKYITSFFPNVNHKLEDSWSGSDRWELRELLSFFLEDMITNIKIEIDGYHQQVKDNNCYLVNPENFFLNITSELEKILSFFNLKKHKKFDTVKTHAAEYISQQQNFIKHLEINEFVKNTIDNISYIIYNLTIFDEAYIQYKLRSQGFEIKCYNLNKFPNNSIDLQKLLK